MSFFVGFGLLTAVILGVFVIERQPALRFRALPFRRPFLGTDVAWFLVAGIASAITAFVFRPQLEKLAVGPASRVVGGLPLAARILVAVVVFDFISYTVHRGLHRSDFLWNFHKVHHSSLSLDGLATTRAHMFENFIRFLTPQFVLFLIGMPVAQVTGAVAVYAIWGVFNHSNLGIDLRWTEPIFITPRMHRRHHIPSTSQNNFGTIFSLWDRCFGQLVAIDTAPDEHFGIPGETDPFPQTFIPAVREPIIQNRQMKKDRRTACHAASHAVPNKTIGSARP